MGQKRAARTDPWEVWPLFVIGFREWPLPVNALGSFLGLRPLVHPVIRFLQLFLSQITDTDTGVHFISTATYDPQTSSQTPNDDIA